MKKHFSFLFASAVLVLTGCSQDEVMEEVAQNNAIEFGTYAGRPAQARATTAATGNVPSFGVFGYYSQGGTDWTMDKTADFMANQKVTLKTDKSGYEYTPIKYWPNNPNDKVSFYAYSPWKAGTTLTKSTTEDKLVLAFEVNPTVTEQGDFLYATDAKSTFNLSKQNIGDKVTFNFAHALSRIGFSAEYAVDQVAAGGTLDSNTEITITEVTLADKNNSELFHQKANLNLSINNDKFEAKWSDQSTNDEAENIASFTINSFKESKLTNSTKKIDQLNADNSYIMIIPQDLQSTDLTITVKYSVTTNNNSSHSNQSTAFTIENTVSNTVKGFNFEMGKAYTFNLILGMTSVKVDATVTDWTLNGTAINVDVPKNTETTPAP